MLDTKQWISWKEWIARQRGEKNSLNPPVFEDNGQFSKQQLTLWRWANVMVQEKIGKSRTNWLKKESFRTIINDTTEEKREKKRFEHESSILIVIMKVVVLWMKHVSIQYKWNSHFGNKVEKRYSLRFIPGWISFDKRCVRTSGWPFSKWNQRLWLIVIYCNRVYPYCVRVY